jgi:hypothetical protein
LRTLRDAKILALGGACTPFSAAHPNDRGTFPVELRAVKVPKLNLAAARDLDPKFHNSKRGEVGPIEAKLLEFRTRMSPSLTRLLVLLSALLASSAIAVAAYSRPSQGLALPAS